MFLPTEESPEEKDNLCLPIPVAADRKGIELK
jgi:hypothetical protein